MFNGASQFNQNLSSWDVTNVTDMTQMFKNTSISNDNKCLIHTAWVVINEHYSYNWSSFCD